MNSPDGWFGDTISRLGRRDEAAIVGLLLRLDQRSRVSRFGSVTSNAALVAHASRAMANAAWIGGAFMDGRLCAIAEVYEVDSSAPRSAEAAFVVEPRCRRRGIATALLRASVHWANASGISTLRLIFSRSDWPMRKLAAKAVTRFEPIFDEMVLADLHVADGLRR